MSGEFDRGWEFEDEGQPGPEGHPEGAEASNTELPETFPTDGVGEHGDEADGELGEEARSISGAVAEYCPSNRHRHFPSPTGRNGSKPPRVHLPR